jgi:hypothetical protein
MQQTPLLVSSPLTPQPFIVFDQIKPRSSENLDDAAWYSRRPEQHHVINDVLAVNLFLFHSVSLIHSSFGHSEQRKMECLELVRIGGEEESLESNGCGLLVSDKVRQDIHFETIKIISNSLPLDDSVIKDRQNYQFLGERFNRRPF